MPLPKVLYIEDDPNNRALVRRILMAYDFDVEESDNALDGIELAKQYQPRFDLDGYQYAWHGWSDGYR